MSERIRIMLCDAHPLLRACIRGILRAETDMEVVATVASAGEAQDDLAYLSLGNTISPLKEEHGLENDRIKRYDRSLACLNVFEECRRV